MNNLATTIIVCTLVLLGVMGITTTILFGIGAL